MQNRSLPSSRPIAFSCRANLGKAPLREIRHESPTLASVGACIAFLTLCACLVLVLLAM